MSLENGIYVADVMFPDDSCDRLINLFDNKTNLFKKEHFIKNYDGVNRKDTAIFIDDIEMEMNEDTGSHTDINEINNYLTTALEEYASMWTGLNNMGIRSTRQKLQKSTKGGGYHIWHHEQGSIDTVHRVLVWTIYLNDVEEGGETEFLHQSERVKARKGKILIFPAGFTYTHRGNPPLSGDKYILTGWWNIV